MLDKQELATARKILNDTPGGVYELSTFFGSKWEWNRRPRDYGKRFKASVLADALPGMCWVGEKSNRHQLYEVAR